jgi:hypothetical protein
MQRPKLVPAEVQETRPQKYATSTCQARSAEGTTDMQTPALFKLFMRKENIAFGREGNEDGDSPLILSQFREM